MTIHNVELIKKLLSGAEEFETPICTTYSEAWSGDMSAKLVRFKNGHIDILIQTGDVHSELFDKAKEVLLSIGYTVQDEATNLYPSGIYYSVSEVKP